MFFRKHARCRSMTASSNFQGISKAGRDSLGIALAKCSRQDRHNVLLHDTTVNGCTEQKPDTSGDGYMPASHCLAKCMP